MPSLENPRGKMERAITKRDILFLKARYLLNQRHFKRPRFKLNPFLERTDDNIDLENFVPDESRVARHLESLVLCESLHSEFPLDTIELSIDNFFPYLNSNAWSNGCSVRVLEGQLLDEILIGLYRLEKQGISVRHSTYAFAHNNRKRIPCYKNTRIEDQGSIEETLILQFTHFGRLTKDNPNPCTLDPFEYIHPDIVDFNEEDERMQESPWNLQDTSDLPSILESKSFASDREPSTSPVLKTPEPSKRGPKSPGSKYPFVQAVRTDNRKLKHEIKLHNGVVPQTNQPRRKSYSTASRPESRRRLSLPSIKTLAGRDKKVNKGKPQKKEETKLLISAETPPDSNTKKLSLTRIESLNFDDEMFCDSMEWDFEIDKDEEKNIEFLGEEFYLSDIKRYQKFSAHKILQQKKRELQERRNEIKQHQQMVEEHEKLCHRVYFPKIETTLPGLPHIGLKIINLPDHVPTFEEFLEILKKDEFYDPRYKNAMRMKSRKIAERYFLATGQQRPSVMYSPDDSEISGMKRRKSVLIQNKNIKVKPQDDTSKKEQAEQVLAVTDSHPCKDHYLRNKVTPLPKISSFDEFNDECFDKVEEVSVDKVEDVADVKVEDVGIDKVDSAWLGKVKGAGFHKVKGKSIEKVKGAGSHEFKGKIVDKVKGAGSHKPKDVDFDKFKSADFDKVKDMYFDKVKSLDFDTARGVNIPKIQEPIIESPLETKTDSLFPKLILCYEESDSSDTESEESVEEPDVPELFNPTKLNTNYSIERIRKKKRSKAKKKTPAFIEILAKYYNMQNIGSRLRADSLKENKKQPESFKTPGPGGMLRQMFKKKKKESKLDEPKMLIGQLKKFRFLDTKQEKRFNLACLSRPDFSFPDRYKFHQLLIGTIDQYVVRREIVVSSRNTFHAAHTSVTFTKISCFQQKDNSCH